MKVGDLVRDCEDPSGEVGLIIRVVEKHEESDLVVVKYPSAKLFIYTPIPATILVVQIDPGPIPTFIMSAPELYNFFAASPVAILPTHIGMFPTIFFNFDKIFKTFSL